MSRSLCLIAVLGLSILSLPLYAQTMLLVTSSIDYDVTNIASDVDDFDFSIEINAPLAAGVYSNPPIISVNYRVSGSLSPDTPSGFESFALEREITGEEFYAQGSSLQFEIAESAVLDDGVQIAELAGSDVVFRFDGREIDNGRFHPALFELRANGTGSIQNSNNTPTLDPLLEIEPGAEYINDLVFDPGNTTLITEGVAVRSSSGGGMLGHFQWLILMFFLTRLKPFVFSSGKPQ